MQFLRVTDQDKSTTTLIERLKTELSADKHVLWLVCGGSNIPAAAKVMAALPDEATKNLAIFLTDERYGEVNHVDSNAKQLNDAGFQTKQAIFVPMLAPGFTLAETQERYSQAVQRAFAHADVIIAQFGIGADGHIAGILPNSKAAQADGWVSAYSAPQYTRVTLTFEALKHISVAFAFVFGETKKHTLQQLRDENLSLVEQPSQILKKLPEAYIYNDQLGDT